MQLIRSIRIERFRSIREDRLDGVGEFTVLAGLNNAGKSNYLRALNTFFTGESEPKNKVGIDSDFYRHEIGKKKKKTIRISVEFELPSFFTFRKELKPAQDLLTKYGTIITKEWTRDGSEIWLGEHLCSRDERELVERFLQLITFRYIPNRVLPVDVIAQEQTAIRDVVVRRLAKSKKDAGRVFGELQGIARELTQPVADALLPTMANTTEINLQTARSLADLVFRFGYLLKEGPSELSDFEQGSGVQSHLMFQTLALIDQDRRQQFGWRQAAVWAIEEPESSLHASMEARLASDLRGMATGEANRLQILSTSHSELMLHYSTTAFFVEKKTGTTTPPETKSTKTSSSRSAIELSARFGASKWIDPILYFPTEPLILVEGKLDKLLIDETVKASNFSSPIRIVCLEDLTAEKGDGGDSRVRDYVAQRRNLIASRPSDAPVVLILDWDAVGKYSELRKHAETVASNLVVEPFPEAEANPDLARSFRGIERFYPTRLVAPLVSEGLISTGVDRESKQTVFHAIPDKYEACKLRLHELLKKEAPLKADDIRFVKSTVDRALAKIQAKKGTV